MVKARIDSLLLERRLVESRQKAQALIMAGQVLVDGRPATKPGILVPKNANLSIEASSTYVSRGGEKLAHALAHWGIRVEGLVAADIGASTGGFTHCLLQNGAKRVYAVDVGYGLLAYRLRQDPRVVVMERVNARYLYFLPEPIDIATIDVSFIGLEKVLPAVSHLVKPRGEIVALFKPQFQARPQEVGKGGVIRDPNLHSILLGRFIAWLANSGGLRLRGITPSPLLGPAGNREFLFLLEIVRPLALPAEQQRAVTGKERS